MYINIKKISVEMNYYLMGKIFLIIILINDSMGETTPSNVKCLLNESLCGSTCYSKESHLCIWNLICKKDEGRCGNICYNLKTQRCIWGLICRKEEGWCANKCYNPITQQCHQGKLIDINA